MNSDVDQRADRPPSPNFGPLVFLIAAFALIDLITPVVLEEIGPGDEVVVAILCGVIAGQCGFLAFWAALGPQRPLVRFSVALATAGALYLLLAIGLILSMAPRISGWEWEAVHGFVTGVLLLPLLSLPLMVPIWILKWIMGCRMMPRSRIEQLAERPIQPSGGEDDPGELSSARQFTLGQILGATTFVAVGLGLASSFVKINPIHVQSGQIWAALLIALGAFFVGSALVALPCIWASLMVRDPVIRVIAFATQTGVLWLALTATGTLLWGPPPDEVVVGILLFVGSTTGTFFFSLGVVRFCGYELMWLWQGRPRATGPPTQYKWMRFLEPKKKPWPEDGMSPFAYLAIVLLCVDLAAVPLAWLGAWLAYHAHLWLPLIGVGVILGLFAGQVGFLAVWAVFGPEPLWVRLLRSTGAALIPCGALVTFWAYQDYPYSDARVPAIFVSSFLFFPLFLLCTQLPVWIFRFSRGYCLITDKQKDIPLVRTWQYELQHLFGITTIAAVLLGLGTLGGELGSAVGFGWPHVLGICVALGAWSAFMISPCIWATLFLRNQPRFGLWPVGGIVVTTIIVMALLGILGILFNLTAAAVLFGCLRFVGNRGYSLARPEGRNTLSINRESTH